MRDVMLAFPHPGTVRTEFFTRVYEAGHPSDSRIKGIADLQTGPGIGMARNFLAKRFLESDCEWLWFVDTDMVISVNTLPALLKEADPETAPVVGAMCCVTHEGNVKVSVYQAARDEEGRFAFRFLEDWPHDTLLRVDATGCGCLLIHRSVFGRITDARPDEDELWFSEMIVDRSQIGEDLSFCMRCAMTGIPVAVHTGVQVGHMKSLQIGKVDP